MEAENNEASGIVYPLNLLQCKMLDFTSRKGLSEDLSAVFYKCN